MLAFLHPFLSIFCRYITYFVGTNDMLVGLHVPTNFQIIPKKVRKGIMGGGGGGKCPPNVPEKVRKCIMGGGGGNASGGIRKETSAKFGIHCLKFNFIMHLNPNF